MQVALELYLVEVVESEGTVSKSEPEYRLKLVVPFLWSKDLNVLKLGDAQNNHPKIRFCIIKIILT